MKNVLILCALFMLLAGCKKECKTSYTKLDTQINNHFNFKSGSYWIFRDSISGVFDSFYVTNNTFKNDLDYDKYGNLCTSDEVLEIQMNKSKDSLVIWKFSFGGNYINIKLLKNYFELNSFSSRFFYEQELHLKHYNDGVTHLSSKKVSDIYSGFYLSSNYWHLHYTDSFASNSSTISYSDYLYNDSVGFVKIRLNLDNGKDKINQVWELQSWKTIK